MQKFSTSNRNHLSSDLGPPRKDVCKRTIKVIQQLLLNFEGDNFVDRINIRFDDLLKIPFRMDNLTQLYRS